MEKLDQLERGFFDIERRLANMDKEHIRYVRGTVTRLGYLLNREDNTKGLVIQLLNHLSSSENREEDIERVAQKMNLSHTSILSEKSLYKRRKTKADFADQLDDEEEEKELTPEEILELNRVKNRYSREEILDFVDSRMKDGRMEVDETTVTSDEEFEKLILAYDYSTRRKSAFAAQETKEEPVVNGAYTYPGLVFTRRKNNAAGE
jgi:hypothetical protein